MNTQFVRVFCPIEPEVKPKTINLNGQSTYVYSLCFSKIL